MTDRVKELEYEVEALKRQVAEMSSLFNHARAAGLDDLIGGHGFQRYAGGAYRLDRDGLKFSNTKVTANGLAGTSIVSATDRALFPGIYILPKFDQDIVSSGHYGNITGYFNTGTSTAYLRTLLSSGTINAGSEFPNSLYAYIDISSVDSGVPPSAQTILLKSVTNGASASLSVISRNDRRTIEMTAMYLLLPIQTSAPSGTTAGRIYYDSTAQLFYVYESTFSGWTPIRTQYSARITDETFAFFMGGA